MNAFNELLDKVGADANNPEHKSLFWIISQNKTFYKRANQIYDFNTNTILPECLVEETFSTSEKAMLRLAFNLYNGLMSHNNDVADIFSVLDDHNFEICIEAIRKRFSKEKIV